MEHSIRIEDCYLVLDGARKAGQDKIRKEVSKLLRQHTNGDSVDISNTTPVVRAWLERVAFGRSKGPINFKSGDTEFLVHKIGWSTGGEFGMTDVDKVILHDGKSILVSRKKLPKITHPNGQWQGLEITKEMDMSSRLEYLKTSYRATRYMDVYVAMVLEGHNHLSAENIPPNFDSVIQTWRQKRKENLGELRRAFSNGILVHWLGVDGLLCLTNGIEDTSAWKFCVDNSNFEIQIENDEIVAIWYKDYLLLGKVQTYKRLYFLVSLFYEGSCPEEFPVELQQCTLPLSTTVQVANLISMAEEWMPKALSLTDERVLRNASRKYLKSEPILQGDVDLVNMPFIGFLNCDYLRLECASVLSFKERLARERALVRDVRRWRLETDDEEFKNLCQFVIRACEGRTRPGMSDTLEYKIYNYTFIVSRYGFGRKGYDTYKFNDVLNVRGENIDLDLTLLNSSEKLQDLSVKGIPTVPKTFPFLEGETQKEDWRAYAKYLTADDSYWCASILYGIHHANPVCILPTFERTLSYSLTQGKKDMKEELLSYFCQSFRRTLFNFELEGSLRLLNEKGLFSWEEFLKDPTRFVLNAKWLFVPDHEENLNFEMVIARDAKEQRWKVVEIWYKGLWFLCEKSHNSSAKMEKSLYRRFVYDVSHQHQQLRWDIRDVWIAEGIVLSDNRIDFEKFKDMTAKASEAYNIWADWKTNVVMGSISSAGKVAQDFWPSCTHCRTPWLDCTIGNIPFVIDKNGAGYIVQENEPILLVPCWSQEDFERTKKYTRNGESAIQLLAREYVSICNLRYCCCPNSDQWNFTIPPEIERLARTDSRIQLIFDFILEYLKNGTILPRCSNQERGWWGYLHCKEPQSLLYFLKSLNFSDYNYFLASF